MASLLKKLGLHDKPVKAAPKVRGEVQEGDEARKLLRINEFTDLPKQDQEAFFRFLRGGVYPEDKDICDVDPKADGMNTKSRQYQFWLQCQQLEQFSKLFKEYITEEDMRLPEVEDCFNKSRNAGGPDFTKFLSEKERDVENTGKFIDELKEMMQPSLNTQFGKFKESLEEQYKNKK